MKSCVLKMARKTKHKILVTYLVDTREKDIDYTKRLKIHKRMPTDGIKFVGVERCTVKPKQDINSFGDISFKWKFEDDEEWVQANFSLERKGGLDLFTTIYTKSNFDRFMLELDRAKDSDFYIVHTDDMSEIVDKILKVRRFNENTCKVFFDRYLKLLEEAQKRNIKIVTSGRQIEFVIYRLIKKHITDNKLNYK